MAGRSAARNRTDSARRGNHSRQGARSLAAARRRWSPGSIAWPVLVPASLCIRLHREHHAFIGGRLATRGRRRNNDFDRGAQLSSTAGAASTTTSGFATSGDLETSPVHHRPTIAAIDAAAAATQAALSRARSARDWLAPERFEPRKLIGLRLAAKRQANLIVEIVGIHDRFALRYRRRSPPRFACAK